MAKKKPIVITIKETRHKKQPWTYTIDKPGTGPMETKEERYSRIWTAKRGALRHMGDYPDGRTRCRWAFAFGEIQPVEWRIERLKTKTKSKK